MGGLQRGAKNGYQERLPGTTAKEDCQGIGLVSRTRSTATIRDNECAIWHFGVKNLPRPSTNYSLKNLINTLRITVSSPNALPGVPIIPFDIDGTFSSRSFSRVTEGEEIRNG